MCSEQTELDSLCTCREVEDSFRQVHGKNMGVAAVLEGALHLEAAVQRYSLDGHPTDDHSLSVLEVEQAGRLVARAGEHKPSCLPVLQWCIGLGLVLNMTHLLPLALHTYTRICIFIVHELG